ncbi:hypothetical protein ACQVRV_00025 (plasmid) [Ralstonia pseudosolanacearum]
MAKILVLVDAEAGNDQMMEALMKAECLGHADYHGGRDDAPVLFQGESALVDAWERGWDSLAELAVMDACPGCNDGTGNPCSIHG